MHISLISTTCIPTYISTTCISTAFRPCLSILTQPLSICFNIQVLPFTEKMVKGRGKGAFIKRSAWNMTQHISTTNCTPTIYIPTTCISTTCIPTISIFITCIPTTCISTTCIPTTSISTTCIPTTSISTTCIPTTSISTTYIHISLISTTCIPTTCISLSYPLPCRLCEGHKECEACFNRSCSNHSKKNKLQANLSTSA
uniref:Uncharacterized protein n=1 Tax=Eptatretus burgeri TaxID=7764 RepID=A0A8C4PYL4_EPTBU